MNIYDYFLIGSFVFCLIALGFLYFAYQVLRKISIDLYEQGIRLEILQGKFSETE